MGDRRWLMPVMLSQSLNILLRVAYVLTYHFIDGKSLLNLAQQSETQATTIVYMGHICDSTRPSMPQMPFRGST